MQEQPDNLPVAPPAEAVPAPDSAAVAAQPEPPITTPTGHTRNGKVARLPKAVRDRLNNFLRDGVPFKQAIALLGDDAKDLNEDNVGNWKRFGGFPSWLKEREFLEEWRAKWEFAQDLVAQDHGLNIHQSINQLLANQIHEAISREGAEAIKKSLQGDSRNAIQLVQAFAQLTKAEIDCERRRIEQADLLARANGVVTGPKALQPKTQKNIEKQLNLR